MPDEIISDVNALPEQNVDAQIDVQETPTEPVNAGNETSQPQTEKPVQSPEENAHFAEQRRAREAAETKAANLERDYSIAKKYGAEYGVYSDTDIAEKYGHLSINNSEQLQAAIEKEAKDAELTEKGMDPDIYTKEVSKAVEEHPDVLEARRTKKNAENFGEFQQWHLENVGTAPDVKDLPQQVIDAFNKGESMKNAFMEYDYKNLKSKQKAAETNQANAGTSPGSVTGNGASKGEFISKESYESNKGDQSWLSKNYDILVKSMNKWGK